MLNFENLDKIHFSGVGIYNIPQIQPTKQYPDGEFIPFNYAKTEKHPEDKIVHCFIDDYQFYRLWNRPDDYISRLSQFKAMLAPDFSTYTDMPRAMQIYNHYRKHWIAAYYQMHGMTVYPTISWADEKSFDWCFDGEPTESVVAVSSVGTQKNKKSKELFLQGYNEMMRRLNPSYVIFYGFVPEECDWNIIRVPPHYDQIVKRRRTENVHIPGP